MQEKQYKISIIVPNHGRKLNIGASRDIEIFEIDTGLERSKQRNIGIRHAKGKYFLILDSDQGVSQGLIEECEAMMEQGYDCLYIPEVIIANSFFGRIRAFERTFYTGTAIDVPRFVRRECCPMFNEELTGPEDADWGNRIPGKRGVTQNVLYHFDDISLLQYIRKKSYYTKSMARYRKLWPEDKCLNIKYRCWTVFVENRKWRKLVRHPILTLGIVFILAVRGWIYLRK